MKLLTMYCFVCTVIASCSLYYYDGARTCSYGCLLTSKGDPKAESDVINSEQLKYSNKTVIYPNRAINNSRLCSGYYTILIFACDL